MSTVKVDLPKSVRWCQEHRQALEEAAIVNHFQWPRSDINLQTCFAEVDNRLKQLEELPKKGKKMCWLTFIVSSIIFGLISYLVTPWTVKNGVSTSGMIAGSLLMGMAASVLLVVIAYSSNVQAIYKVESELKDEKNLGLAHLFNWLDQLSDALFFSKEQLLRFEHVQLREVTEDVLQRQAEQVITQERIYLGYVKHPKVVRNRNVVKTAINDVDQKSNKLHELYRLLVSNARFSQKTLGSFIRSAEDRFKRHLPLIAQEEPSLIDSILHCAEHLPAIEVVLLSKPWRSSYGQSVATLVKDGLAIIDYLCSSAGRFSVASDDLSLAFLRKINEELTEFRLSFVD